MAKKKNQSADVVLKEFNPKPALKKIADNLMQTNSPTFTIHDNIPIPDDKFRDIRNNIHNLEKGKVLEISNENTGLTISELQGKISKIAFNHKKKFVEKNFITKKLDDVTIRVWRSE